MCNKIKNKSIFIKSIAISLLKLKLSKTFIQLLLKSAEQKMFTFFLKIFFLAFN